MLAVGGRGGLWGPVSGVGALPVRGGCRPWSGDALGTRILSGFVRCRHCRVVGVSLLECTRFDRLPHGHWRVCSPRPLA